MLVTKLQGLKKNFLRALRFSSIFYIHIDVLSQLAVALQVTVTVNIISTVALLNCQVST
jgi:hypothetical protein